MFILRMRNNKGLICQAYDKSIFNIQSVSEARECCILLQRFVQHQAVPASWLENVSQTDIISCVSTYTLSLYIFLQ